jgi:glycosyltransferase involved in cell wall biosynthesis
MSDERSQRSDRQPGAARIACLLPARNCENDLPGYFESVSRFADVVVALDDGSTDATREFLAEHPLVQVLLTNPRRNDYRGWDDSENRTRLLEAVDEVGADWIFFLDADERLDPEDAAALKDLVSTEARRGCAYQFRIYRMIGDGDRYEFGNLWVARLFAPEPGQTLPIDRLHLVPVPTSIPRERWIRTTIRIQHYGTANEVRREVRYGKYLQADPDHKFQGDYSAILLPPQRIRNWERRTPALPLLAQGKSGGNRLPELGQPIMSAVVICQNDEATIEHTLSSVTNQKVEGGLEVIVVCSGSDQTAEIVRTRFPQVRLVELDRPALPGEARNIGLKLATGVYVSFPGSHVELVPGCLAARVRAHQLGYPVVNPSFLNGTKTWSGWASYFLDHCHETPNVPSGECHSAPWGGSSYLRQALVAAGGFPTGVRTAEDSELNKSLFRLGYAAYRESGALVIHHARCRRPISLLIHHYQRGRGEGRILLSEHFPPGRLLSRRFVRRFVFRYVPARVWWTTKKVWEFDRGLLKTYLLSFPMVVGATITYWAGLWSELLRPARGKWPILFSRMPGLSRLQIRNLEARLIDSSPHVASESAREPIPTARR